MAYKEKYYINYCDDFNVNRRVSILKKDYTGESVELLSDVEPVTLDYESTEDFKFSPIRASKAEIYMIFGSDGAPDFEEFWIADEKEFKVQLHKETFIEWSGFIIPNGFQYEFKGGLYYATLEASDGLSALESITFVDDNQKPYGNQNLVYNDGFLFPFSLIATEILKKTELDLDLWVCVDSYEKTMLKVGDVREADPLSASFVNVKTYIKEGENENIPYWYGSGEEWNCKEVLENLLYIFGAKLYQEEGVWRLKTTNSDIDYGNNNTQRYWRKYNTAGVYLPGYELINDERVIPCGSSDVYLVENDHVMSMDDVYKAFRMNYEYTLIRDGDTPFDILPNGNFCNFENTSILAAPEGWYRWRYSNKWYIRVKDITIPFEDAGGNTCGIEIGTHKTGIPTSSGSIKTDPNPAVWTSLRTDDIAISKGESITFSIWNKFKFYSRDYFVTYVPLYKCVLYGDNGDIYYLRNSFADLEYKFIWQKLSDNDVENFNYRHDTLFFYLDASSTEQHDLSTAYINKWYYFESKIQDTPVGGTLDFAIHGLGATSGRDSSNFPKFKVWKNSSSGDVLRDFRVVREGWEDQGGSIPRLQITGLSMGVIPDANELPESHDYVYNNDNPRYTLQADPITVYNGDTQNDRHISNIIVPTNTSGGKNFWDDLSNSYGYSSLGLLTVREIMRQYARPYRMLEGTLKIQEARFGSVYKFDTIPNVRFILQRGTFNKQKQYIEDATFIQISGDELSDGGSENGNTLDPIWDYTGNYYCMHVNGVNNGFVITEEEDVNPNSETYGETREIRSDFRDYITCPLSQPRLYFWGTDDVYLNTDTLKFSPFEQEDNEVQVSFDNEDGNYIYFVHLKSLGSVERIYTPTSPGNVLEDWIYLDDVTIDGYIYRVLRTDYVMTEFTGFTHNFKFT